MDLSGYNFAAAPQPGLEVELGIRPEHVAPCQAAADTHAVRVRLVEPMGSDQLAWTELGGARLSVRLPAETPVAPGDELHLRLPPRHLNLFDLAGGHRL